VERGEMGRRRHLHGEREDRDGQVRPAGLQHLETIPSDSRLSLSARRFHYFVSGAASPRFPFNLRRDRVTVPS
jgi:hypothetical protein